MQQAFRPFLTLSRISKGGLLGAGEKTLVKNEISDPKLAISIHNALIPGLDIGALVHAIEHR